MAVVRYFAVNLRMRLPGALPATPAVLGWGNGLAKIII